MIRKIRLGLLGARGRMGQWVSQLAQTEFLDQIQLVALANSQDSLLPLLECDVVIDFSSSQGMSELAQTALQSSGLLPAFVVGSTGWTSEEYLTLEALGKRTAVLVAANFSAGVFVTSQILKQFSPLLKTLGYTPVLVETHHVHKKDAPSGTALYLRAKIDSHHPESVQTHCIRAGEVIGDHEITFFGTAEKVTISHSAQDRSIWARGSIQTALWLSSTQQSNSPLRGVVGIEKYFESLAEAHKASV